MTDKPEALRLADDCDEGMVDFAEAAAELRCLHEANEAFGKRQEWWNERMFELEQQRDELLEVLREIGEYRGEGPYTTPWQDIVRRLGEMARAAIAKVEGEKK